jgi:hypothetical protein
MGGKSGMRLPTFTLFIILSSGIFLMAGILFLINREPIANSGSALTPMMNILGTGVIPF